MSTIVKIIARIVTNAGHVNLHAKIKVRVLVDRDYLAAIQNVETVEVVRTDVRTAKAIVCWSSL